MANMFNMAEVLDIGIEKEKKRRDFYGRVADSFREKDIKELFSRLRDWEETHIKKFNSIREKITEPGSTESSPGEFSEYANALISDRLYSEVEADTFAEKVSGCLSAIDYGLQFERDAILFFSEVWRFVPEYVRHTVEELIEEERKHVMYLSGLRKKYQ